MKTDTELKARAFDLFIKAASSQKIDTEAGRGWIVSASTLQAIYNAEKITDKAKSGNV